MHRLPALVRQEKQADLYRHPREFQAHRHREQLPRQECLILPIPYLAFARQTAHPNVMLLRPAVLVVLAHSLVHLLTNLLVDLAV
jgi:hypothetical protein